MKHPITGCTPDQLFLPNIWAIDPEAHQRLLDICVAVPLETLVKSGDESSTAKPKEEPYEKHGRVAVVSMEGPITKKPTSFSKLIGGSSTIQTQRSIRLAAADPSIDRILIRGDSPGGTSAGVHDLYTTIRNVDQTQKPVYGHADDLAASAMYYILSATRRITAGANAKIGSIGAYTVLRDTSGVADQKGVKLHVISSGKFKGAGEPGAPIPPEVIEHVQQGVNDCAELFISSVAQGRKMSIDKVRAIADGRVIIASRAKEAGLIDGIQSLEDVIAELNSKSPLESSVPGSQRAGWDFTRITDSGARRSVMLNADQIRQARTLPGAETVAEEQLDTVLLQLATTQRTRISTLETELRDVRAKLPIETPQELLEARLSIADERIGLLASKGLILPPQVELLKKSIRTTDGKPNVSMLSGPTDGQPYIAVLQSLELNKPNGVVVEKTQGQPAPKTEPGSGAEAKNGIPTYERWAELREMGGFPRPKREEYKTFFGLE